MGLDNKDEILKSISLTGNAEETKSSTRLIVGREAHGNIIDFSSGLPRIKPNTVNKFVLVIGQPLILQALNPFEIRCCLCNEVIRYPAWYWVKTFAVNQMHFFVCFDPNSSSKVTASCYRR